MAAGFMAGFGTTMAKLIENDREYFRDRAAKRQEYLQTYGTRAVTDRQDKAAQSMSVVNSLITAGVPKEDVRYVLDKSGIQGLAQLKATIDSRTDLTPEERTTLVKKASDYVANNKGEDFETVINRAWGLYKTSDNPVQRERNIFSAMLGLDANMMEEDVLDDLYVNGYSGRDIYRIMGTSGPKPGEALDLNLPAKPPSDRKMAFAMTSLENQFEAGIDSAIKVLKGEQAKLSTNDKVALQANYDKITELEILKGQGVNGWATWAKTNPSFYEYAKSLEDTQAGVVTRNLAMRPFIPAYRDFFEEAQDEANMAAGAGDSTTTTVPTVTTTPPGGDGITLETGNAVMEFETIAEFNTAAAAGNIPAGAGVSVNEPIKTEKGLQPAGTVFKFKTKATPETTGSGDMSVDTSKPITFSTNIEDARALASELSDRGIEAYPVIKKDDDKDTVLVQIGVYETKEDAEAAYKKLETTVNAAALASPFMAYPDDYEPIYEATESGGKKFVRLRLQVPNKEPTDLGDMSGAPGFRERDDIPDKTTQAYNPKPELTVEDRINAKREATTQVAGAISDIAEDVNSKLKAFDNTLDVAAGNAMLGIRAKANTVLGALAQVSGNDELADSFYRVSVEAEDGTRKGVSFDKGLVDGLNQVLDDLGVPDYSKVKDMPEAVNQYVDDPNIEGRDLDADLGVGYEPATTRLFSTMDRLKRLRLAVNKAPEEVTPEAVLEAVAKPDLGMEQRIRDDARQFLQDEKSFPQPLPNIVIDDLEDGIVSIVQQLIKKRQAPTERDVKALKARLKSSQYRGPISDKTLKEKLDDIYNFYTTGESSEYNPRAIGTVGSRDLGLRDTTDDVRPPRGEAPDRAASLARPATPEADRQEFDSPRNMAVENMTTRGRFQTPSGLMSRPSPEAPPQLGSAEFNQLVKRVHGSSKAAKAFGDKISSGKLTTADVARMIKATNKLPNTKTKDQLLLSLYDLRDSLNKR